MTAKHWRTGMKEMHRSYSKSVFVGDLKKLIPEISAGDLEPGGSGVRAQAVSSSGAILDDFHILRGTESPPRAQRPIARRHVIPGNRRVPFGYGDGGFRTAESIIRNGLVYSVSGRAIAAK